MLPAHVLAVFYVAGLVAVADYASDLVIKDGDTIKLNGTTYCLDGTDAPENEQVCLNEQRGVWACGTWTSEKLNEQIGTRAVRCDDRGPDCAYPTRRIGICTVEGEPISLNEGLVPTLE